MNSNIYTKSLDNLMPLFITSRKDHITKFLTKNFKENIHYIKFKNAITTKKGGCGKNRIEYLLTEETFELVKNSFNLKHRYITKIGNSQNINIIMSLENQTIGFIDNIFKNIIDTKRQQSFNGCYMVDLYFPEYKLVIECDENNHEDRNFEDERKREKYILSLGNTMIRFNPNDKLFDLSIVINRINQILFNKNEEKTNLIIL